MTTKQYKGDVCAHSHAIFLDNFIRRLFQSPAKIVGEYISAGDTVVDIGCGPGYFTIDMAGMTGPSGKVVAVDLQDKMLEDVKRKAAGKNLTDRIVLHQCGQDNIGMDEDLNADFILAYYMVHETPDTLRFLKEVKTYLKKGGRFLIVEPLFHVSKKKFREVIRQTEAIGFNIIGYPPGKGGRSLLLSH